MIWGFGELESTAHGHFIFVEFFNKRTTESYTLRRMICITFGSTYFCFDKSRQNHGHSLNSTEIIIYLMLRRNIFINKVLTQTANDDVVI
jgi:hypothetical protein